MGKKAKKGKNKKGDKKKEKNNKSGDANTSATGLANLERSDEEKQLAIDCRELKNKYFIEERLLNEFQQNVIKIESELMMEKQKSFEIKNKIRDKLREKQEINDEQEHELKIYQEKIRYLLHEHELLVTNLRIECEEILKTFENINRNEQYNLQTNIGSL
eukprot:538384_1